MCPASRNSYMILCDNQVAIDIAKHPTFHARTKHIDMRYRWIRDALEEGSFEVNELHTNNNGFDMLTKTLAKGKLKVCCSVTGMGNSFS